MIVEQHYIKNSNRLIKMLRGRVGTIPNAEDVVHEAYARALRFLSAWNTNYLADEGTREVSFGNWFKVILNNATRDHQRVERAKGMSVAPSEENMGERALYWDTDSSLLEQIQEDIDALPQDDRSIMHLYFNMQYAPREIVQLMEGITDTAVRQRIFRFKRAMQEKYDG